MKTFSKLTLVLFICLGFTTTYAQAPAKISIQGTLKDANGAAVDDGTYTVEFRLYYQESGGAIQWFEVATVESAGGIYSHYLGSVTPLNAEVFGQTLYLGIKVGAYELVPRTEMTYAPYTFASNTALSALKVVCSGAVGDVKYSILNPTQFAAENGTCWVPMDGRNIFGKKLATILGASTIPNVSGLFLRAQEYTDSNDPDRSPSSAVAQTQSDGLGSHGHSYSLTASGTTNGAGAHSHTFNNATDDGGETDSGEAERYQRPNHRTDNTSSVPNHEHSFSGTVSGTINNAGGSETRPKNMNLYVYIRVD